jgi:Asp-tRNA(Asn)/Glu-tRNA(Gln) amidotransferase A subunit family amidase
MVQVLLDLGAIPYVKTNIPQTMMAGDSHNYVFGRTLNPHKSNLSAGGSSGGEGALIAMRGSVLGVGTDIAGSVRIPSFCNGVFGLRPSENRLPYGGQTSPARAGLAGILPVAGPLATSVRDLQLFASLVVNEDPWKYDSACIFSTWRVVEPREKLRLGFILEDPHFPVHPPILKTLTRAVEALKAAGHEVVELTPPSIREACLLAFRLFAMDPAGTAFKHIQASDEPTIPALATTTLPHEYMPEEYAPLTLEGLYDLQAQREEYKEKYRLMMLEAGIETLIMPAYQTTAPEHDMVGLVPYTVLNNVVDVCVCHQRLVDKSANERAVSRHDHTLWESEQGGRCRVYQRRGLQTAMQVLICFSPGWGAPLHTCANMDIDNPDAVDGAPCAVQLVSRNMREVRNPAVRSASA